MSVDTAWLKTTPANRGQDHLATRVICEILYGQLLPGITNVTDRGRYYTLYPWLLWTMDQEDIKPDDRVAWFRKADCLLTLIALRHGAGDEHGRGAVGSDKLTKALRASVEDGTPIVLSRWARPDEHAERYFANQRGGLGQYYLGPLESLGIVGRGPDGGLTWSTIRGRDLAQAVDATADRTRFARCIAQDAVGVDDLDALSGLCLCRLCSDGAERDVLVDVLWSDPTRRHALGLILALAHQLPDASPLHLAQFRGATATGVLQDGRPWRLPAVLERARTRWAVYQRSEWLSVAVQGLFWATLRAARDETDDLRSFAAFGDLAVRLFSDGLGFAGDPTFEEAVAEVREELPDPGDWTNERHEHRRAHEIVRAESPVRVTREAVRLVLSMLARAQHTDAFAGVEVSADQRGLYPVNLVALEQRRAVWSRLKLRAVLHDLVTTWGVRLHDRVALRKLRSQLNDTFQIRPTEDGALVVVGVPEPVFGSPRFDQAVRILQDIGALDRATRRPTVLGAHLLGGFDE